MNKEGLEKLTQDNINKYKTQDNQSVRPNPDTCIRKDTRGNENNCIFISRYRDIIFL